MISEARTPLTVIAKRMTRTEVALRRKAGILGIGLGHRRPRCYWAAGSLLGRADDCLALNRNNLLRLHS